jgi:hypothetical protein
LFKYLQFPFCYCNVVLVFKCCFQNHDLSLDIRWVDTIICNIGLDLGEIFLHKELKGVA